MILALPACGFLVGTLVGFSGMGGGSVMTALLILVFGMHPVTAVGTDLLFAAATKSVGAREHARRGGVDWRIVGLLALGSVPGTILTILVLNQIPNRDPALAHAITLTIGIALVVAASSFLFPRAIDRAIGIVARGRVSLGPRAVSVLTVVLGLGLGSIVSLTSVGAGVIGLALLRQLYPRTPMVGLVGSDIAHAVPLTLIAGFGHWLIGDVKWDLLGLLLLGSIPGIIFGSRLAHVIPERLLRPALGVVLTALSVPMLLA